MTTTAFVQDMVIDKLERLIKPVRTLMGANPVLNNAATTLDTCLDSIKKNCPDIEHQQENSLRM